MHKSQLDQYRKDHPEVAESADADRERVSALLSSVARYEGKELDTLPAEIQETVRELVTEKCVTSADDIAWEITGRGRALLAWRAERGLK